MQPTINQSGDITKISLESSYNFTEIDPVKIYMAHTSKSSFSSNSDWVTSGLTLVYNGAVDPAVGWNDITLSTPFNYNNSDNLLILIDNDHSAGHGGSSSSRGFYTASGYSNQVLRQHNDYTDNDYGGSLADGTRDDNLPSLKLTITTGPSITCGSLSGSFSSCSGSAGSNQTFTCEGSSLTADYSYSTFWI